MLRSERDRLELIFQQQICDTSTTGIDGPTDGGNHNGVCTTTTAETLRQNELYMRHELQQSMADYVAVNEQLIALQRKLTDVSKRNKILANRLRDNGLDSSVHAQESAGDLAAIKRMAQSNQGIFKYDTQNRGKILQKLIVDLTPRVAITLLPCLPAYIVFMCIR